jgi:hypothetical protein
MNRVLIAVVVVVLLAGTSIGNAAEEARQKYVDFFQLIVGNWQITNPAGNVGDYTLAFSKSKACFIADNEAATHIHGWNPEEKTVSVMSFYSNGNQGISEFRFQDGKTLVGEVTIRNADGTRTQFKATWSIVDDRQELTISDQKWTLTRRK